MKANYVSVMSSASVFCHLWYPYSISQVSAFRVYIDCQSYITMAVLVKDNGKCKSG